MWWFLRSTRVISTGKCARDSAAFKPPNPPPIITIRVCLLFSMSHFGLMRAISLRSKFLKIMQSANCSGTHFATGLKVGIRSLRRYAVQPGKKCAEGRYLTLSVIQLSLVEKEVRLSTASIRDGTQIARFNS